MGEIGSGTLIAGRYRVVEAKGETLLAENVRTGVRWALRPVASFRSPAVAALLAELRHPALPRVLEEIEHEGVAFLVVEFVEGETLEEAAERSGGRIAPLESVRWMSAVARAVDFLHWQEPEPLLHLDVKPSNVVIGVRGSPCLIDFGAALPLTEGRAGSPLHGTPGYAAPEVATGRGARIESDVFSLGATLARLLTGRAPDPSSPFSARALMSDMDAALARIVARCCALEPVDRFGSANEVAAELEGLLPLMGGRGADGEEETEARRKGRAPDPGEKKERRTDRRADRETKGSSRPAPPAGAAGRLPPSPLCVWDSAAFGCEFASVLAAEGRRVLVVDADLLNPRADLLLGLREERRSSSATTRLFGGGGLDEAMEEHARGRLTPDAVAAIARPTAVRGVWALAGDYRMEDYEYYSAEGLAAALRAAGAAFDAVVVLCGRFLYDTFTCLALMLSEAVVVPVRGSVGDFREFNRYIAFLASRRQLDRSRVRFVAIDYHPGADLGWGTMDELAGGAFVGCVSDAPRRRTMASAGRSHAAGMEERSLREYRALLPRLCGSAPSAKGGL